MGTIQLKCRIALVPTSWAWDVSVVDAWRGKTSSRGASAKTLNVEKAIFQTCSEVRQPEAGIVPAFHREAVVSPVM